MAVSAPKLAAIISAAVDRCINGYVMWLLRLNLARSVAARDT
jgi:hypothetical protein